MISATDALKRLRDGNQRFVSGESSNDASPGHARRSELVDGQSPFAIVLACSDSRVPVELIFDQGLGDLFVVRVAGNIATPTQIGSVEYAADQLGAKLVVVMGHNNCGAVAATLDVIAGKIETDSPNLQSIVDRIRPVVEELDNPSLHDAVVTNIRNSANRLYRDSFTLGQAVESGELKIVAAEYSLESGEVRFLDD